MGPSAADLVAVGPAGVAGSLCSVAGHRMGTAAVVAGAGSKGLGSYCCHVGWVRRRNGHGHRSFPAAVGSAKVNSGRV